MYVIYKRKFIMQLIYTSIHNLSKLHLNYLGKEWSGQNIEKELLHRYCKEKDGDLKRNSWDNRRGPELLNKNESRTCSPKHRTMNSIVIMTNPSHNPANKNMGSRCCGGLLLLSSFCCYSTLDLPIRFVGYLSLRSFQLWLLFYQRYLLPF